MAIKGNIKTAETLLLLVLDAEREGLRTYVTLDGQRYLVTLTKVQVTPDDT